MDRDAQGVLKPNSGPALPVELYQEIFRRVFQMDVEQFELFGGVHLHVRTPLTVGSVCRRWRNVVLSTPELWTFIYCKFYDIRHYSREARDRHESEQSRIPRRLSNAQSLFLERSAGLPLRICLLRTGVNNPLKLPPRLLRPRLSGSRPDRQLLFLELFPSQRIRQISCRTYDHHDTIAEGDNIFSHELFIYRCGLTKRLQQLPALETIDLAGDAFRHSMRAVYHRNLRGPLNKPPKLDKFEIYEEGIKRGQEYILGPDLLRISPSGLTCLTLSNTKPVFDRYSTAAFQEMGPSLTYLKLVNVSWSMNWADDVFCFLPMLTDLRLEETRPVHDLTEPSDSDRDQASRLERTLLDTLPNVAKLLTRLSGIEIITNVPVSARGLLRFLDSRPEGVELVAGQFRVVVSRSTFTASEIGLLRAFCLVEVV